MTRKWSQVQILYGPPKVCYSYYWSNKLCWMTLGLLISFFRRYYQSSDHTWQWSATSPIFSQLSRKVLNGPRHAGISQMSTYFLISKNRDIMETVRGKNSLDMIRIIWYTRPQSIARSGIDSGFIYNYCNFQNCCCKLMISWGYVDRYR